MIESAPVAWQDINGQRKPVSASYVIYRDEEAGFALADYQPGVPVVIDPVLVWKTIFADGSDTLSTGIAADSSGNLYVTGKAIQHGDLRQSVIGSSAPHLFLAGQRRRHAGLEYLHGRQQL
jgi:hypothetical protein